MPVVVDIISIDPDDGAERWRVEASVDLIDGTPALVEMRVRSDAGLDPGYQQESFRWASPIDIVSVTIPQLLARGLDPYDHDLPIDGFPIAAYVDRSITTRLTDEFLEEIAARYVALGRGYATAIASERQVSRRTAISWVEKARERGILTPTTPGAVGGTLVVRPSSRHSGPATD